MLLTVTVSNSSMAVEGLAGVSNCVYANFTLLPVASVVIAGTMPDSGKNVSFGPNDACPAAGGVALTMPSNVVGVVASKIGSGRKSVSVSGSTSLVGSVSLIL